MAEATTLSATESMTGDTAREFQINRSKSRHGLVIGAVCGVIGVAVIFLGGDSVEGSDWLGGLLLVFGAGVAWHGYRLGRGQGPCMRIDRGGVYFREWGLTVPWREIEDIYQSGSRFQPFVTLMLRDAARFQAHLSEDERRALRKNHLWRSPELRIPYAAVEATRDEILDALGTGQAAFGGRDEAGHGA